MTLSPHRTVSDDITEQLGMWRKTKSPVHPAGHGVHPIVSVLLSTHSVLLSTSSSHAGPRHKNGSATVLTVTRHRHADSRPQARRRGRATDLARRFERRARADHALVAVAPHPGL